MADFSPAALQELERREREEKAARREALRVRVRQTEAPFPADLKEELLAVFEPDMRELLRGHPGYKIAVKRDSYKTSLAILRRSASALLDRLRAFEAQALADGARLFGPLGERRLAQIELEIQKELFTFANSALSLVEHGRRAQRQAKIEGCAEKLDECFGTDGLHAFVTSLRVLVYHVRMVEAGWNLTTDRDGGQTAAFVFQKSALIQIMAENRKSFTAASRAYVEALPRLLDLGTLVADYVARVDAFNDWMASELASDRVIALYDYDGILRSKSLRNQRMMLNAFLVNMTQNGNRPPNPHDHLHRFLSPEQLAEVNGLPRNSAEQVDRAIEFIDRDGAVDEAIRERIHELFRLSGSSD